MLSVTSSASVAPTVTVLVKTPGVDGASTSMVTEVTPAAGMVPRLQATMPPDSPQPVDADTKVVPAGRVSVSIVSVAVPGPAFAMKMV